MPKRWYCGLLLAAIAGLTVTATGDHPELEFTVDAQVGSSLQWGGQGPMLLDERRGVFYQSRMGRFEARDLTTALPVGEAPIDYGPGNGFTSMAFDVRAQLIYVVDDDGDAVQIVDPETRHAIGMVPCRVDGTGCDFRGHGWLAVNAGTGILYQTSARAPLTLSAFDPERPSNDLLRTRIVPLGIDAHHAGLAANPNTNLVYVAALPNCGIGEPLRVFVVDGTRGSPDFHTRIAEIQPGSVSIVDHCIAQDVTTFAQVAVNARTNRVFIAADDMLHVLDGDPASPTFHQFIAQVPLVTGSSHIASDLAVNAVTNRIYVRMHDQFHPYIVGPYVSLTVVDGVTNTVTSRLTLPNRRAEGWLMLDPSRNRLFVNDFLNPTAPLSVLSHPVNVTEGVSTGTNVTVLMSPATISFVSITSPGGVSMVSIDPTQAPLHLPGHFSIAGAAAYEITSSAGLSGSLSLCFNVSHIQDPVVFASLRVLHGENGSWVDRTSSRDPVAGTICATTESLSPFAIARLDVGYVVRELFDSSRSVRAGATVPLKIQLRGPDGTNLSTAFVGVTPTGLRKVSDFASVTLQDAGNANPDATFRFDSTLDGGGYIFNLKTTGLAAGTYELTFTATGDPGVHSVRFQLR